MQGYVIALFMVQQLLLFGTGNGSLIGGAGRRKLTEEEGGSLNTEDCLAKLKPVLPKVALLVLTRDGSALEPVWTKWLEMIEGQVPKKVRCDPEAFQCFQSTQVVQNPMSVYDKQYLFTIYLHPPPHHMLSYSNSSIFHGREVRRRHRSSWGSVGLVKAHKSLLQEALEDPFNQQFQLVGDNTVPIRHPSFVYSQLIGHPASRIEANMQVGGGKLDEIGNNGRFHLSFYEAWPDLKKFRSGHSQWVTLNRKHAQVVADDQHIISHYERHCYQLKTKDDAFCVPDESYVGTVVHSHLDNASDVDGNITMLRLSTGDGFDAASISEDFLLEIRGSVTTSGPASHGNGGVGQQDWHGLCKDATLRYQIPLAEIDSWLLQCEPVDDEHVFELYPDCYLFCRKFASNAAETIVKVWSSLGIVTGSSHSIG